MQPANDSACHNQNINPDDKDGIVAHCHFYKMAGFNSFLTLGLLHFKLLKKTKRRRQQADGIAAAAVSNVSVMTIRRLQNTFNTKQIRQCLVQAVG